MKSLLPDFDKVKSVKSVDFGNIPNEFEAFVYLYTNIVTGQMYLGYHLVKEFGKNYFHSSTFKKFISIFTGSEEILEYKILAYGTKKHMKSKEYQMLTDANAMHNDMYYNKSNGSPAYHIPDLDKCRDWANRLISGDDYLIQTESISDLNGVNWVQVRAQTNDKRRRKITSRINDAGGNIDATDPVILFESDNSWDGMGGNHTYIGIDKSEKGHQIKTIRLYEKDLIGLTPIEKETIATYLNSPEDERISGYNSDEPENGVKWAEKLMDAGVSLEDDVITDGLKSMNYDSVQRTWIRKQLKKIAVQKQTSLLNQIWVDYTVGQDKKDLEAELESINNTADWAAFSMSSGYFNFNPIVENLTDLTTQINKKTKEREIYKTNVIIKVYHPMADPYDKYKKEWDNETSDRQLEKLNLFFPNYTFIVDTLPCTKANGLTRTDV